MKTQQEYQQEDQQEDQLEDQQEEQHSIYRHLVLCKIDLLLQCFVRVKLLFEIKI